MCTRWERESGNPQLLSPVGCPLLPNSAGTILAPVRTAKGISKPFHVNRVGKVKSIGAGIEDVERERTRITHPVAIHLSPPVIEPLEEIRRIRLPPHQTVDRLVGQEAFKGPGRS